MKKIRKNYLESLDFNKKNKLDEFIKNETLLLSNTDGFFYNELNYLTFDEIEYLINNLDKECEMYQDLCRIYEHSKEILNKFNNCIQKDDFNELTEYEENRILILKGFITHLNIFPNTFEKLDEDFIFDEEELKIKNKFEENVILKRINLKLSNNYNEIFKYNLIFVSLQLYLMRKNNIELNEEIVKNLEQKALENSFELRKIFLRPSKNDINTMHVLYLNEKDDMNKFVYYHKIINSSKEQNLINELFKRREFEKLNINALLSLYLTGGGNPFIFDKNIKIFTINNEVLDEIKKIMIERYPVIEQLSNSRDEKIEKINKSKQKIIEFKKRID